MKQRPSIPSHPRRGAGAGLVTAIFLLVVLAGLAVALVAVFGAQRQSAALDEQGARAYQAARAGIEWGLFQRATDGADCSTAFALPGNSPLAGFSVRVECEPVDVSAFGNTTVNLGRWIIRATACSGAAPCPANSPANSPANAPANPPAERADYVERVIEVQI
ncbi:agglutinin biogenesis protein MshP [Massilia haematophila]|uniref:Agglutinin biogenesis protein MshP n=1 Tax=Massilia haematophila TaxID=457923 RepID=A0ABV7PGB1_9BURK